MDSLHFLFAEPDYYPYLLSAGMGAIVLSIFKFLRRLLVIGGSVVVAPVLYFKQGSGVRVASENIAASELDITILILALGVGVLVGFLMPISLHGKSKLVPAGMTSFGTFLVIGVMCLMTGHFLEVIHISYIQEMTGLVFIGGVASGFCLYSFIRLIDAVLPLCGWAAVVCAVFFIVSPQFHGAEIYGAGNSKKPSMPSELSSFFDPEQFKAYERYFRHYMNLDTANHIE